MKRTTTRRKRELKHFYEENRRLFPFMGLFLAGVALGVCVYLTLPAAQGLSALLRVAPVAGSLGAIGQAFAGRLFSALLMLGGLYLLGLWACGAPFVLAVPLFYGLGLGLTEAHYYAMGGSGVLAVVAVILPHGLLTAAVLVTAGAESLRMSAGLGRHLLPEQGGEGLWDSFRLYSLRYVLLLAAAVAVCGVDVGLRWALAALLP